MTKGSKNQYTTKAKIFMDNGFVTLHNCEKTITMSQSLHLRKTGQILKSSTRKAEDKKNL